MIDKMGNQVMPTTVVSGVILPAINAYVEMVRKIDEIIEETNTHEKSQTAAMETICGRLNDLQGQIINIEKVVGRIHWFGDSPVAQTREELRELRPAMEASQKLKQSQMEIMDELVKKANSSGKYIYKNKDVHDMEPVELRNTIIELMKMFEVYFPGMFRKI